MMSFIRNLTVLTFKEVKSVASDVIMMIFMIYLCTVAVVMAAQNITTEVRNARSPSPTMTAPPYRGRSPPPSFRPTSGSRI